MESEYDQRQYKEMLYRLEQSKEEPTSIKRLGALLSDLEALSSCLQASSVAWRKAFRREWGILEEIYSVALNKKYRGLSAQDDMSIADALIRMKQLLAEQIRGK